MTYFLLFNKVYFIYMFFKYTKYQIALTVMFDFGVYK